jgi:cell division protein FtsW (lipid II flippase)
MMHAMNSRSVRQFLSFALMAAFFFVVFYLNVEFLYKVFMAVLVFAIVFLLGLADEAVKQIEDKRF